ncbi:tetratricopeptide repeat protein [Maribacter algicola]|uniref:Tetratricopeptide repeat protein n=1 Tax=Meishania litoralis TaxID=3434685 RepID=A0ACC7LIH8_9FLAO
MGLLIIQNYSFAQEETPEINLEPSAEVFLEEYTDEFQEKFFEALKQKGIGNHDKAVNLLLECKRLDSDNSVVAYELAKAYFEDKQYLSAKTYAVEAIMAEPDNYWYLNTLVAILQKEGSTIEETAFKIPIDNVKLSENLAMIYFKSKNYEEALAVLKRIKSSSFREELTLKINDSIQNKEPAEQEADFSITDEEDADPSKTYKGRLEELMNGADVAEMLKLSAEALESYPLQPYFYYAQGYALNKKEQYQEAVEVLEISLDYLLDDPALENKIYKELADAHQALNNTSKANMYLRKIKPGF